MKAKTFLASLLLATSVALSAIGQTNLTNGLVAYYTFNGNANDSSGNGYNGTVSGAILTTNRLGTTNSAYLFNGNNSAVALPAATFENLTSGTIAAWIKLNRNTGESLFAKQDDGNNSYGVFTVGMYCNSNGNPSPGTPGRLYFVNNRFGSQASSSTILSTGVWYYVVSTFSPTNCNLYVNGTNVGSFTNNFGIPADNRPTETSLGYWEGQGNNYGLSGSMYNALIYNQALSSNQVAQLYQSGGTPRPYALSQPPSVTNNLGDTVTLSVTATNGPALSYNWQFSGTNVNTGTNSTLTITNLSQSYFGRYAVVANFPYATLTSTTAAIYEPPTFITQPVSVVAQNTGSATFTVAVVGYPPVTSYQWEYNGNNIVGANTNTFSLSNLGLSATGNYQVLATNTVGSTLSAIATLNLAPYISSPFAGGTPIWGRDDTLAVGAMGSGTLSYQWYFNGAPISGATASSLDFPSIQFTNSGLYSVVISSPYGSVTNVAAQVSVAPAVVTLSFSPTLTINGAIGNGYTIQRSADLTNTNNWNTLTNLTLTQPVEIWVDTSVDASSPFNSKYFYQVIPNQ